MRQTEEVALVWRQARLRCAEEAGIVCTWDTALKTTRKDEQIIPRPVQQLRSESIGSGEQGHPVCYQSCLSGCWGQVGTEVG